MRDIFWERKKKKTAMEAKRSNLYRDETTTAEVESALENAATSTESEDRQLMLDATQGKLARGGSQRRAK